MYVSNDNKKMKEKNTLFAHRPLEHRHCDSEQDDTEGKQDENIGSDCGEICSEHHDFPQRGCRVGEREEIGDALHVPRHLLQGEEHPGEEHHREHQGHHDHSRGFLIFCKGGDQDA